MRDTELLPPLNELGYLLPGIHPCSLDDVIERFGGGSPEREVETQELIEMVAWARRAGVMRIIVNGSYVSGKLAPNNADVVILPGADYPREEKPAAELDAQWPFLQVFVAVDEVDLTQWSLRDFGTDRHRRPKGVVEVLL